MSQLESNGDKLNNYLVETVFNQLHYNFSLNEKNLFRQSGDGDFTYMSGPFNILGVLYKLNKYGTQLILNVCMCALCYTQYPNKQYFCYIHYHLHWG